MTARFSQGKYSLAISDRSGQAFPYPEMVREWNGAWVHISEYEPKSPQLELKVTGGDPQALQHPRTARAQPGHDGRYGRHDVRPHHDRQDRQ